MKEEDRKDLTRKTNSVIMSQLNTIQRRKTYV